MVRKVNSNNNDGMVGCFYLHGKNKIDYEMKRINDRLKMIYDEMYKMKKDKFSRIESLFCISRYKIENLFGKLKYKYKFGCDNKNKISKTQFGWDSTSYGAMEILSISDCIYKWNNRYVSGRIREQCLKKYRLKSIV